MKLNWKQKTAGFIAVIVFLTTLFYTPWKIRSYHNGEFTGEEIEYVALTEEPNLYYSDEKAWVYYELLFVQWLAVGIPALALITLLKSEEKE